MALILSGSVDVGGSMTATTIVVSAPGAGGIVSSSQQIQNYNTFAVTGSANTFYGSQTITGSVNVTSNIGVGIIPTQRLHIAGPSNNIFLNEATSGNYAINRLKNGTFTVDSGVDSTGMYLDGAAGDLRYYSGSIERLRIGNDGTKYFGVYNGSRFQMNGAGENFYQYTNGYYIWGLYNDANSLSIESAFAGNIIFRTAAQGTSSVPQTATEKVRITSIGNLNVLTGSVVIGTAGQGIDFSATSNGSGTQTSELLNDYEEGTWTASIRGAGTAGTYEISTQYSHYTKIGRQVTISSRIIMNSSITGGGTDYLQIQGLPYAKLINSDATGIVDVKGVDTVGNYLVIKFVTIGATSTIYISEVNDNTSASDLPISALSANDEIGFTLTYITA